MQTLQESESDCFKHCCLLIPASPNPQAVESRYSASLFSLTAPVMEIILESDTEGRRIIQLSLPEMAFECFEWIVYLLNESVGLFSSSIDGSVVRQLPDDIVVDILSRLPAERVVECRRVCRRWRLLTSSHHFIKLHLSRATSQQVLLQPVFYERTKQHERGKVELGLFIYDPTIKKGKKMKKLQLRPGIVTNMIMIMPFVSCDGLLLFLGWGMGNPHWFIFNPVTQEQMAIAIPPDSRGFVCGFFYHPLKNKYNILYRNSNGKYCMYTFGDHVWRSIKAAALDYAPSCTPPAIFNGALHWISYWFYERREHIPPCSHGIVVFDMNTEEFSTKPHPGGRCQNRLKHSHMSLLTAAKQDQLLFSYRDFFGKYMDIWILEEYTSWRWVQKWKVALDLPDRPLFLGDSHVVRLLHFEDSQLLLKCEYGGLYLFQLDNNVVKKLSGPPKRFGEKDTHFGAIFTKSPISLRDLFFDHKLDRNNIFKIQDGS